MRLEDHTSNLLPFVNLSPSLDIFFELFALAHNSPFAFLQTLLVKGPPTLPFFLGSLSFFFLLFFTLLFFLFFLFRFFENLKGCAILLRSLVLVVDSHYRSYSLSRVVSVLRSETHVRVLSPSLLLSLTDNLTLKTSPTYHGDVYVIVENKFSIPTSQSACTQSLTVTVS